MEGPLITFPKEWEKIVIKQEMTWSDEYDQHLYLHIPMIYDAALVQGHYTMKPWDRPEDSLPILFAEWNQLKEELHERFAKREQKLIVEPMKKGIGFFLEVLHWSNYSPVSLENVKGDRLKIKPVNLQERMDFIFTYPNKYHSYVQLSELFIEMEKMFRKQQAIHRVK